MRVGLPQGLRSGSVRAFVVVRSVLCFMSWHWSAWLDGWKQCSAHLEQSIDAIPVITSRKWWRKDAFIAFEHDPSLSCVSSWYHHDNRFTNLWSHFLFFCGGDPLDSVGECVDAPAAEDCGIASVLHGVRDLHVRHSLRRLRHLSQRTGGQRPGQVKKHGCVHSGAANGRKHLEDKEAVLHHLDHSEHWLPCFVLKRLALCPANEHDPGADITYVQSSTDPEPLLSMCFSRSDRIG